LKPAAAGIDATLDYERGERRETTRSWLRVGRPCWWSRRRDANVVPQRQWPELATSVERSRRPTAFASERLVHAALSNVAFDADGTAIRAAVEAEARVLLAPDEEKVAAFEAVRSALAHPVVQRAAKAVDCSPRRRADARAA